MDDHIPFITDARHLEAVAGSGYLVLRPPREVSEAYLAVQAEIQGRGLADGLSYPRPHLTLKGFGVESDEGKCSEVELLAFDGGPERLVGRYPLTGG